MSDCSFESASSLLRVTYRSTWESSNGKDQASGSGQAAGLQGGGLCVFTKTPDQPGEGGLKMPVSTWKRRRGKVRRRK